MGSNIAYYETKYCKVCEKETSHYVEDETAYYGETCEECDTTTDSE